MTETHAASPPESATDDGFEARERAYIAQRISYFPWEAPRFNPDRAGAQTSPTMRRLLEKWAGCRALGTNTYVSDEAIVHTNSLTIGRYTTIAAGAILRGWVTIGDDCTVNTGAHLAGKVTLGNGVRVAGGAAIYGFNHGHARTDTPIWRQPHTSKGVVVGEGTWIGANSVIVDGVTIGAHCIVAAGATVTRDVPDYCIVGGVPAKIIAHRRGEAEQAAPTTPPAPAAPAPAAAAPAALTVRRALYAEDPYADLPHRYPKDLQGWGSDSPVFRSVIAELKPRLIVEVGTWKGGSAVHMAAICRELKLPAEIVCIDTWLGNWQHWSRSEGVGSRADLRIHNGMPRLYWQFMSNIVETGMQDIITPLPLTGVAGAKLFAHMKLRPDIVYIDGDHEYESVRFDLALWLDVLAPGGVLIGDDYDWPGVRRAVTELIAQGRHEMRAERNKFTLRRTPPA
jgi:acetyltransferase-like isoleucine patch superfamily enzyme/predicted O-methyltransferase YrrM